MAAESCPSCEAATLEVDPSDHWRRICASCGEAFRVQHTLLVGVGRERLPLPAPQAKVLAAVLRAPAHGVLEPPEAAVAAAAKIHTAIGPAGSSVAFSSAELHQIGLALIRLEVKAGLSGSGANLRDAILGRPL